MSKSNLKEMNSCNVIELGFFAPSLSIYQSHIRFLDAGNHSYLSFIVWCNIYSFTIPLSYSVYILSSIHFNLPNSFSLCFPLFLLPFEC